MYGLIRGKSHFHTSISIPYVLEFKTVNWRKYDFLYIISDRIGCYRCKYTQMQNVSIFIDKM